MWFDPSKGRGVKCDKCKGSGIFIDFAVGLGHNGLVPSYVSQPCPKCQGDGFITPIEREEWRKVTTNPVIQSDKYQIEKDAFLIPDSYFLLDFVNWVKKLLTK
jgi:hypothetical protein